MTDIRTAAEREAERAFNDGADDMSGCCPDVQYGFERGAEWAVNRVTPTREQVANELGRHWYDANTETCDCGWLQFTANDTSYDNHLADAVLALIAGLAEGESNEPGSS